MMDVEEDGAVRVEEALLQHSPLYTIMRMLSRHGAGDLRLFSGVCGALRGLGLG